MPKSTAKSTTDEDLELLAELGVDITARNYRLRVIYYNGTESDLLIGQRQARESPSDRQGNRSSGS